MMKNHNHQHQDGSIYIYELPYNERRNLCRVLDQNQRWQELAGWPHMQYDTATIQEFQREVFRGNSPSNELLNAWGHKNHTVLELFILLKRIKHYQAMSIIKQFVDVRYHAMIQDEGIAGSVVMEPEEKVLNNGERVAIRNVVVDEQVGQDNGNKVSHDGGRVAIAPIRTVGASRDDNASNNLNVGVAVVQQTPLPTKPRSPLPLLTSRQITLSAISSCVAESAGAIPQIHYDELRIATSNWDPSNVLGKGGFGTVFQGTWKCTKVAIKRIESKDNDADSYMEQVKQSITELYCLTAYRHDNILPIYGYSIGGPQPCLIYQYMPGGSLDYRLFKIDRSKPLTWQQRLNIATGTAQGLQYLHTIDKPLIHGDIKSANILLDPNDTPRIGDFGLAREGPQSNYTHITLHRIHGTRPYLPDEFLRHRKFSTKVDTYSFGVVLFEMATRLRAYVKERPNPYLKDHVVEYEGDLDELRDRVVEQDEGGCIFKLLIEIGKKCVSKRPHDRPEMIDVYKSLYMYNTND